MKKEKGKSVSGTQSEPNYAAWQALALLLEAGVLIFGHIFFNGGTI